MAIPTAADAAQSWVTGLTGARAKIQAGIEANQVAPGQLAARQKPAYVAGVTNNQDKWAQRVGAVSNSDWQAATIAKLDRISSGATQSQPKMEAFMSQLLPYIASQRSQLAPRGNLDQNIARLNDWVRRMAAFSKK